MTKTISELETVSDIVDYINAAATVVDPMFSKEPVITSFQRRHAYIESHTKVITYADDSANISLIDKVKIMLAVKVAEPLMSATHAQVEKTLSHIVNSTELSTEDIPIVLATEKYSYAITITAYSDSAIAIFRHIDKIHTYNRVADSESDIHEAVLTWLNT